MVGFVFDVIPLTHNSTGDSAARGDNPTTKTRFRSPRGELCLGGDAVWVKTQIDKQLGEVPKHIKERSSKGQGTFSSGESFECFEW